MFHGPHGTCPHMMEAAPLPVPSCPMQLSNCHPACNPSCPQMGSIDDNTSGGSYAYRCAAACQGPGSCRQDRTARAPPFYNGGIPGCC